MYFGSVATGGEWQPCHHGAQLKSKDRKPSGPAAETCIYQQMAIRLLLPDSSRQRMALDGRLMKLGFSKSMTANACGLNRWMQRFAQSNKLAGFGLYQIAIRKPFFASRAHQKSALFPRRP
jgi:hypothetical protein